MEANSSVCEAAKVIDMYLQMAGYQIRQGYQSVSVGLETLVKAVMSASPTHHIGEQIKKMLRMGALIL